MKILTIKEISQILNVKIKTLYQWAELNQIPHIKMNGCLRFDLNEIEKWVQNCKKGGILEYNNNDSQAKGLKKGGIN
ncbi:MAG: helix-turn-helix domain-containing protein [Nitrospirae bacterium]|nr:helix-turn-helix domain-containing protein [Nitrospirota bacterium]MBF0541477.1 helix-turn-helix domain-containing protein [Nitrospirota bacterium]